MCLLMWKPAHVVLTRRDIADYYQHNSDGFGVMWQNPDTGRIAWYKMVGSQKATWRAYQTYAAGRDCALHFRMATSGLINVEMAHPFKVTDSIMMMHNGVLACRSTASRSDTAEFASIMRRELERHPERLDDESYINALDDVIGPGNRLMFMRDGNPEPVIVGKDKGLEHNGSWYSNTYAWTNEYEWSWRRAWDWDSEPELITGAEPVIDLSDPEPKTEREKRAAAEVRDWLSQYRYADVEETVEYFTDWHARTDAERVRMRAVLTAVANGC